MIDLHTHTTESDGTYTPAELIEAAREAKLEAMAITDHDTFAGYELAHPLAEAAGVRLLCGIELSTKLEEPQRKTLHLLAYFLKQPPASSFVGWLQGMKASRRDRNVRLVARLQSMGVDIRLEEVQAIGRSMAGRPHFARLMVEKGYVSSYREAFDKYLDESAPGYVDRDEPSVQYAISLVRNAGGISSLAHPIRLGKQNRDEEEALVGRLASAGLDAIEAYHSDHTAADAQRYRTYAGKYGLKVTGGSDFHGENKPNVRLGTGIEDNLHVSSGVLDALLQ